MSDTSTEPAKPPSQPPPAKPPEKKKVTKMVTIVSHKQPELVSSTPNVRNWRGMLIALLVIVAVLGLILFSIVLLSPPDEGPRVMGTKFTLDHITGPNFKVKPFNGSWVSDSEVVFRDVHGGLSVYNADNNSIRVLMTNSTFRQVNAIKYKVSSDLKFVLLMSDIKKIYTNTYEARYHIYEISTQNRIPLSPLRQGVDDNEAPLLQLVEWAPRNNGLAFVYHNDLYYKPKANMPPVYRITTSGSNVVTNGSPDWLYQEEILKSGEAIWFSPDGRYMAFATFNDTLVGQIKYPFYGPKSLYPKVHSIRYPKPGTANPEVRVWVADLSHPKSINLSQILPSPIVLTESQQPYLISVSWRAVNKLADQPEAPTAELAIVWLNRRQNISVIAICFGAKWTCEDSHIEKSPIWVEPSSVMFSEDGMSYLTLLPVLDGDAGSFSHVCIINKITKQVTPLTHGQLTVTQLLAWDSDNHIVYFEAVPEGLPSQRHIYRVPDTINMTLPNQWQCLTCPITVPINATLNFTSVPGAKQNISDSDTWPVRSSSCLYTRALFPSSPSPRYYLVECLGPDPPKVVIMDSYTNTRIFTLDNNTALIDRFSNMSRPQIKIFKVEVETGFQAQVKLMLPPGLRESEDMTFPLLLKIGGYPGSQSVTEKWEVDWSTYLVSQRNFIIAEIDGRGSGFQGNKMKHEIFHKIGGDDIEDQISVITYLRDNLKFIDKTRMGVWGKGYGGFATTMILTQDIGLFHCGIALAPITSWAHYDSVFTERLMGTPNVTDNYRGYEESDLSKRAGNLQGKPFLLIHGSADNTVHLQHSMILVHALTEEGVMFRHQTYPDEGHNFNGVQGHLYRAMEAFWDECFGPLDFAEWEVGTSFFTFKQ